jgi:hypothetical protein
MPTKHGSIAGGGGGIPENVKLIITFVVKVIVLFVVNVMVCPDVRFSFMSEVKVMFSCPGGNCSKALFVEGGE